MQELRNLLARNRSVRRFEQGRSVGAETLRELVALTRLTASGRNAQPLRYRLVTSEADKEAIFPLLAWAGYFTEWPGPAEGERPAAYLVQCLDTDYGQNCLCDDGLQLEAITLGAATLGLSCCIIKAFNAPALERALALPENLKARYVLAIGYAAENVVIEDMDGSSEADFKYYRTPDGTHHVPKRPLSELIIGE